MSKLKNTWDDLLARHTDDQEWAAHLWLELSTAYGATSRAYHNLTHLQSMLAEMDQVAHQIDDPDLMLFSIFYHDIVYDTKRKDNEKKSAEKAVTVLQQLSWPTARIDHCYAQILLTQKHQPARDTPSDDCWLLDFDLEVLSRDWSAYQVYCQQIRKEYWIYPSFLYKKGRRAAMGHFLEREFIYQTAAYRERKEAKARANIRRELDELLGGF